MKPIIGLTCNYVYSFMPKLKNGDEKAKEQYRIITSTEVGKTLYASNDWPYNICFETDISAIEMAGGIPFIIPRIKDVNDYDDILSILDGIVFTGGNDINPKTYGEENKYCKGLIGTIDGIDDKDASMFAKFIDERDAQDLLLAKKAIFDMKIPVLGLCRGNQIINIACGGDLFQDQNIQLSDRNIDEHSIFSSWNTTVHNVTINKDSILYDIVKTTEFQVNSLHHQSIRNPGENIKVTSYSHDGLIESIEYDDKDRFVLGIQWHPEMLAKTNKDHLKILERFINEAKIYKKTI